MFALQFKDNELVVDRGYPLCLVASLDVAALIGDVIYLIGGSDAEGATDIFWALDLAKRGTDEYYWGEMPPFPVNLVPRTCRSPARWFFRKVYVFSGRNPTKADVDLLTDSWRYDPPTGEWLRLRYCA